MKIALFLVGLALASAAPAAEKKLLSLFPTVDVKHGFVHFQRGDSKIIGGTEATQHEFPWQVALIIDDMYFCGGSLISYNTVLTAGHCTLNAKSIEVIAGAHNQRDPTEPSQQSLFGTIIITHEDYGAFLLHNDIGLVVLDQDFEMTAEVQPIGLPADDDAILNAGEIVTVSGWGLTSDGDFATLSDVLMKTDAMTMSNVDCAATYGSSINDNIICIDTAYTGTENHGTCSGDSGGPMMWNNIHRGLTSFGAAAGCDEGFPNGFTRTVKYRDWIRTETGI